MESLMKKYIHDANKITYFKLIRNEQDLADDKGCFHPDMSHQIFGQKESVFGYKDLKIKIYYGASSLEMYVNVSYSKKLNQKVFGVKADDVRKKLEPFLLDKFHLSFDQFSTVLFKEKAFRFRPFGNLIHSYAINVNGNKKTFEIYKVTDTSAAGFQEYLIRMESFITWFIDAASFVDINDWKWDFFLLFEKSNICGITTYYFIGYSTCYRFYFYPDKYRPKISQMLILPPFQRQGHCTKLIKCIYNQYCSRPKVYDITVEDPSNNFQRLRDFIDCTNCLKLAEFQPSFVRKKFTKDMAKVAREKYKINKRQARRVYEILRLKSINVNNDRQFREFRLAVKSRIYFPMKNEAKKRSSICKRGLSISAFQMKTEEKHAFLEKAFQDHYTQYNQVVDRLERA